MDAMADLDLIIIDESFLEFADAEAEPSVVQEAMIRPNVIVLRSLGKNFGLHGIRFGYMVANPSLAGRVRSMLPKWNLNAFAEYVVFMLKEHGQEYMQSLHQVRRDRLDMASQLSSLPGLTVYPSQGNFLFVRLPVGAEGTVVRDRMLTEHRILVRECGNKIGSSSRFLRLVVRPQVDVRRLVSGLEQVLYGTRRGAAVPELSTGTNYSSGTAAVDRLVSATNGGGMPGLAAQALGTGMPGLTAAAAAGTGMPTPMSAPMQMPTPVPMPAAMQMPAAMTAQSYGGAGSQSYGGGGAQSFGGPGTQMQQMPQMPMQPQPQPVPQPQIPQPQMQQPPIPQQPQPQQMVPQQQPTPSGVPARNGLTAAQVRGTTGPGLAPAPATGWPAAQSWPNAAGMGQAG